MNFSAPPVVRGRITNARTKEFLEFHLNPDKVSVTHATNFVTDLVPGSSHALRRWASGGVEECTFNLKLDGDMSLRRFGVVLENSLNPTPNQPFSIQGFLDYLRAFNFPTDPLVDVGGDGGTDQAIFNFGSRFRNWPCDIQVTKEDLTEFGSDLVPTAGTMDIKLCYRAISSVTYSQVWRFGR